MPRRQCVLASVSAFALVLMGCADAQRDADVAISGIDPTAADDGGEPTAGSDEDRARADDAAQTSSEAARTVSVVATVAPIADLVSRVGGERVDVTSLIPSGADSHTYEPRPSDIRTLAGAHAYIGVGLSLNDAAVQLAEEHLADDAVLSLLGESALDDDDLVLDHTHDDDAAAGHTHDDDAAAGHTHDEEAADHTHDGDAAAGHTHDEEAADHTHDGDAAAAGPNPHVWTSLRATRQLIPEIARVLGEVDPEGQSTYDANAAAYLEEIDALDASISEAVETIPADNRTLVTYHEAWSYFARDYGLSYARAVQPEDYSEPSASEVRAVIDAIRELDVDVVFGSEEFPTPVLESIARETGAEYIADLSDDVLPGEPGSDEHAYLELMRGNAEVIVDGLGGSFPATD